MKKYFAIIIFMVLINIVGVFALYNIYSDRIDSCESSKQTFVDLEKNLKEESENLKEESKEIQGSLLSEINTLTDKLESLDEEIENLNNEITALKEQKQKDENTISSLTQQLADLQNENTKLKNKLNSITEESKKETPGPTPTPTPKPEPKPEPTVTPTLTPTPEAEKPKTGKVAYLTFDDGPSVNTPKVLDILDKYKINATFFVIGGTSDFYKETIKDIVARGNAIGNHTYSHDYKNIYASIDGFNKDFKKNEDTLASIIGYEPEILRFPGGSNNQVSHKYGGTTIMKEIIKKLDKDKYQYFDWNVSSSDAEVQTQDKNKIINSVINGAKNKNNIIVLFHDSKPKTTTVEALPTIIEKLQDMGFEFRVLTKDSYTVQFEK